MPDAALLAPSSSTATTPPVSLWLRPRRQLVLLAAGLFLCLWIVSWFGLLGELEVSLGAEPVTLILTGIKPEERQRIAATYVTTVGDSDGDLKEFGVIIPRENVMIPDVPRSTWRIARVWVKTLHLTAPESLLASLASVEVRIGVASQTYRPADLARWKRMSQPGTGLLPNRTQPAVTIELPIKPDAALPAINSAPMGAIVQRIFTFPLIGLGIAICTAWLLIRYARSPAGIECWRILTTSRSHIVTERGPKLATTGAFWLGFAFSAAGIGLLYAKYSYPFTQDDNFSQFLPMALYNCRTVFEGHWPAWNPHQFLGAPVATLGIYSVTYPPLYFAYGLARLAGHEYWTIEIFTLLHLAAGYALLTSLLRRMGVRPSIAAAAASSYVLSGWFLIAGRSQMTFAPLAVWPVAMAWSLHHLGTGKSVTWTWTLLSALSIGFFFHAGHSQMWVYAMMLYVFGVAIHWLAGNLNWRQAVQAVPALLMGIGLALPLLILQAIEGTSSARAGSYGDRIEFLHMLLPLGSLWPRPMGLGTGAYLYFCEMYYSGTLFQAISFLAILLACARFGLCREGLREFRAWVSSNVWLVLFSIAIVFGLGSKGILWTVFSQFPVFDRFRWPIKFEYFCLLYSTLGGAVLAERWFSQRPRLLAPVLAAVACLLLVHVNLCRTSWYDFADRPYPPLPGFMESRVTKPGGRLLTRWQSMDRSSLPGFYQTLPLSFATQAGAYSIGGYDTFLEGSLAARRVRHKFWKDPVAAARAYGVQWIASDRTFDHPVVSPNQVFWSLDTPAAGNLLAVHAAQDAGQLAGSEDGLTLHELSGSDPMAFVAATRQPLPIEQNSQGAFIRIEGVQSVDNVICNVAMRPWMHAADNQGRALATFADEWGRVGVQIGQPAESIAVIYQPPWSSTLLYGALLVILGGACALVTRRFTLAEPDQADSRQA